jgi:hypothetical protein
MLKMALPASSLVGAGGTRTRGQRIMTDPLTAEGNAGHHLGPRDFWPLTLAKLVDAFLPAAVKLFIEKFQTQPRLGPRISDHVAAAACPC